MAWTKAQSDKLYGLSKWGAGYFSVDDQGYVIVSPLKDGSVVRVVDVVAAAEARHLRLPLHIRFQDILQDRVKRLNEAFSQAIAEANYQGAYQGVYPVKVNQTREVVETLIDAGQDYNLGIEAGSKPELLLCLSLLKGHDRLLICNGYKDDEFLRLALMGTKLGKTVIIVIEKLAELQALIGIAANLKLRPLIGIRIKLATRSSGQWATSSGEMAKFGLSTVELLEAVERLEAAGLKDCLALLHFHIGSQIPDIQVVSRSVHEAARFYAKLIGLGCPIRYLDVGGGLAVDYDGTRTAVDSSANYSLREYANSIVYGVLEVCEEEKVAHPVLISESGRALVAHHSMIVAEAFAKTTRHKTLKRLQRPQQLPKVVKNILDVRETIDEGHWEEAFHDLNFYRQQALNLFNLGYLDLQSRALVESLVWEFLVEIVGHYETDIPLDEELRSAAAGLVDQYLVNFSVFRSLPDLWAVGQLFPVVPVQRLDEEPTERGSIVDITCDSDGKVDSFIGQGNQQLNYLPLHELDEGPYYLGFFLTGAYQDTLGDMHNLFGRMDEAHVVMDSDEEAGWYIDETVAGDSIREVLEQNEYSYVELVRSMKQQIDRAIKTDVVKPNEGMRLLADFEAGLKRCTYLKSD